MVELPVPPFQHYLGRITQDPDKPEIYWLHFMGSSTPYAVPVDMTTAQSTCDFLTNWLDRREETEGPWTNWSWATPRPPWVSEKDPHQSE